MPALIPQAVLHTLLEHIPGGQSSLNPHDEVPIKVDPHHDLKCLHGRHCIEAAKKYLHPDNKWWIFDLYTDGEVFSPFKRVSLILVLDLGEAEVNEL